MQHQRNVTMFNVVFYTFIRVDMYMIDMFFVVRVSELKLHISRFIPPEPGPPRTGRPHRACLDVGALAGCLLLGGASSVAVLRLPNGLCRDSIFWKQGMF